MPSPPVARRSARRPAPERAAPAVAHTALEMPIQFIKGVGPRLAERFAACDIHTCLDALMLLPRRYEDRRRVVPIAELVLGERASFTARVLAVRTRRTGPRRQILELVLGDDSSQIVACWFRFHPAAFAKRFEPGQRVRVAGKVEQYRGVPQLVHPDVEPLAGDQGQPGEDFAALVPVYPEIEGLYPKTLRLIMRRVVEFCAPAIEEILPAPLRLRHALPSLSEALQQVHCPAADADAVALDGGRSAGHRRLVFEEFLLLQLGLAVRRERARRRHARSVQASGDLGGLARELFGFELTAAQRRVLGELVADLGADRPMNRLLQGDVGSGKTALAVLAAVVVERGGGQTAFMAPTEVLAEQHHRRLRSWLGRFPDRLEPVYLSSAVKGAARREALARIAGGSARLVVGTQALLEETVEFADLRLCVIDEQHRFGVLQRAQLRTKGPQPHVLVMTATPIPRTLAMTLYGDLDVSLLDELPPGRRPVRTVILRGSQVVEAYHHVRAEVAAGARAFIVYPLVEESDKIAMRDATRMFGQLGEGALRGLRLGLLHGRMDQAEKSRAMEAFAGGALDVLVSTTVIEVGVDVPAASVMVVEHAERFGLSQLHQLRGRVGRGERAATCFLVAHGPGSEDARSRLRVLARTQDGFEIAEEDLAIRGPGEFLGTRQSGMPAFLLGNLARDADLLAQARAEAKAMIDADPALERPEHLGLRRVLWVRWGQRLSLAEVG